MSHHGHHDVELEIPARCAREGHGRIVANDPSGQLHETLAHDRIDLSWHDRGTWLPVGQDDLKESAARSRA